MRMATRFRGWQLFRKHSVHSPWRLFVSSGDYTVHEPGDHAGQLGGVSLRNQRLLESVQHGDLRRFATVRRHLGFLRH